MKNDNSASSASFARQDLDALAPTKIAVVEEAPRSLTYRVMLDERHALLFAA